MQGVSLATTDHLTNGNTKKTLHENKFQATYSKLIFIVVKLLIGIMIIFHEKPAEFNE